MTSRQRIRAAIRREPVDRIPVAPYLGNHAARKRGPSHRPSTWLRLSDDVATRRSIRL